MIHRKSPVHLREILIGFAVGIILLVLGGLFDRDLTTAVYDPVRTNVFGIVCTGITELPVCLTLLFGALFGFLSFKTLKTKFLRIGLLILSIGATGFAIYYTLNIWLDMTHFQSTQMYNPKNEGFNPLFLVLGIVFDFAIVALVASFGIYRANKFD